VVVIVNNWKHQPLIGTIQDNPGELVPENRWQEHVTGRGWRGSFGTVGRSSPRCFFWVLPKRSIPKPT